LEAVASDKCGEGRLCPGANSWTPRSAALNPGADLSPRIINALKESPREFLALVFREFGEWLKNTRGVE
jgi:hypothetical protein